MAEHILEEYKSRRNRACLVQTDERRFVVKIFAEEESFQKELQVYNLLQGIDLPCAKVIRYNDKTLVLSNLPGKNLVDCLEHQERTGQICWEVWEKLAAWLTAFHKHTGLVMTDVNLRNFLFDDRSKTLYGLDFEECNEGNLAVSAACIAAYIRTYKPENTDLKQNISRYVLNLFARNCKVEVNDLFLDSRRQEEKILECRKNRE